MTVLVECGLCSKEILEKGFERHLGTHYNPIGRACTAWYKELFKKDQGVCVCTICDEEFHHNADEGLSSSCEYENHLKSHHGISRDSIGDYFMMIDETQATFSMTTTESYDEACKYMEDNYGDPSETCEGYPCFKGADWESIKSRVNWNNLMNYIENKEGLSVSWIDAAEEQEINPE